MRSYTSLRRRSEFSRVHRHGRRRTGTYLTTLVIDGGSATRVGLVVSTAVGDAVRRNRLRRSLRALLDRYGLDRPPFRDLVVLARPGAAELDFLELAAELERTFGPRP